MEAILECVFQILKHLYFSDFFFLNFKIDLILHMTIAFSLKQGQTEASSGPITVPLTYYVVSVSGFEQLEIYQRCISEMQFHFITAFLKCYTFTLFYVLSFIIGLNVSQNSRN